MPDLQRALEGLEQYPSDTESIYPLAELQPPANWGFTIYRTYYGPSSDDNWKELLATTKRQAEQELMAWDDDEAAEKLKPLFRLDTRSDPSLLSGLDRQALCQIYKEGKSGKPMPAKTGFFFWFADEDMLNQVGEGIFIVKAVDTEEKPREEIPLRDDDEPTYWGWMRMETRQLLELWGELEFFRGHQCMTWTVHQADLDEKVWEGSDAD
ncbi:hypothetical protein N0V84_012489 [Fusarium piperis]|uniref:Uncharacterized protein n=1 Tax=Fusarium piperis TaxID=1435070 RepID=A0A9W8W3Q0_9HYPO|nr:hypothetical protein N0V84_012489 [Fusarium piperis]